MNSLGPLDIQLLYTVKTLQNDGLEKYKLLLSEAK
jgi:hypothetical protein